MLDVSVIIVNYNTSVLIRDLLATIEEKTEGITYEIIVVDNNPTESFAIDLKDYQEKIIYLPLKENVGFGRANNEGLKISKGRNIFFLNPDTLLLNNAIKILSDYLDKNKNVGVCGGNLYDANLNPNHSYMPILPSPLWDINFLLCGLIFRILKGKNIQFNFTSKPLRVGYITGADMMIKRSVIDIVGPFDPDFFMYYEETELSYRIKKSGFESHSIPDAKIIHLEGMSCDTSERRERMKNVSKKIYYSKTQSKFNYRLSSFLFKIYACLRLTLYKLIGNSKKYNYWNIVLDNL